MRKKIALLTSTMFLVSVGVATAQDAKQQDVQTPSAAEKEAASSTAADASENSDGSLTLIALPEWHPVIERDNAVSVDEILDFDVYGPTGEEIGEIENVLFGLDGEVNSVIAEVGGVWDIGDTHVNVPWSDVDIDTAAERVVIPVTQETVEDYTLFTDEIITAGVSETAISEVSGDGAGVVATGPRVWQARELISDYVRVRDGDGYVNYGYVDDIVIQEDKISAVVVRTDVTWGTPGAYAYPYYGYSSGWRPGSAYYDLPYQRNEVGELDPFDDSIWDS